MKQKIEEEEEVNINSVEIWMRSLEIHKMALVERWRSFVIVNAYLKNNEYNPLCLGD